MKLPTEKEGGKGCDAQRDIVMARQSAGRTGENDRQKGRDRMTVSLDIGSRSGRSG
jgi:hypothetical protein